MEFDFDVHKIFLEPITKLDSSLIPSRRPLIASSEAQKQIMTVIDEIGKASAKAQRLPAPITSASRMQTNKHHLYILKDCTPKTAGRGAVIGFLKVGCKKLFVLDQKGSHIEAEPLCILDFYIHETLQRHGFGKELFTFMLKNEQVDVHHLAIDRPSEKFLSFLRKHFNLWSTIPQVNNFVVFDGFFRDWKASVKKTPAKRTEGEIKPYSLTDRDFLKQEEGLPWPFSQSQLNLNRASSLGSSPTRACSRHSPGEEDFVKSLRNCRPHSLHRTANSEQEDHSQRRRTSAMNLSRGLMAQKNGYSRYSSPPPPLLAQESYAEQIKEQQSKTDNSAHWGRTEDRPNRTSSQHQNESPKQLVRDLHTGLTVGRTMSHKQSVHFTANATKSPWCDGPSYTVLGTVANAAWVRRKQELRSTRPW
ncbi:alpha-tubulin N-acetyltransferase 1 isoform X2 [Xenopus tropicalis]|uniref:Alpha-tubulin N-acetyltransferase 1 n=1 Tax=Xenopus tropicalis TaxID=8364 RepID=A0A8J0SUK3_XENTR|nr:alpha-tubulin N-acetyltransferase 1 isoform X2 [Xenopus tropicalis]